MTSAPARPAEEISDESVLVAPQLRDVCLRIPLPSSPTDEQLERLNQLNEGWKIELGSNTELEVRMIAGGDSSDVSIELSRQVANWRVAGGGGRVRDPDGAYKVYHPDLGNKTRAPDVSWISPALLQATPNTDRPKRGFWTLCPTFVIEVRSPSDSLRAQRQRMHEWLLFGAELGWLVDPLDQTVWIYRPNHDPESLVRPATLSGEDVLEGLEVDMAEVWSLVDETNAGEPSS
jgi:Uma2 family endonuclease